MPTIDSRLKTYCMRESLATSSVSLQEVLVYGSLMQREGFSYRGANVSSFASKPSVSFTPFIEFDKNINGGNPDRPLVLNGLTFSGEREFLKKSGVLGGLELEFSARNIYGVRKYVDYSVGGSYAHSLKYGIGVGSVFANLCSRNHLRGELYADGCISGLHVERELSDGTKVQLQFGLTQLFTAASGLHQSVSLGWKRHIEFDKYIQNQVIVNWQAVQSSGHASSITISLGQPVPKHLALRYGVGASASFTLMGQPVTATMGYSFLDGGRLLGVGRQDQSYSLAIGYSPHPNVIISIGYKKIDSNILYFREQGMTFNIKINHIRI